MERRMRIRTKAIGAIEALVTGENPKTAEAI